MMKRFLYILLTLSIQAGALFGQDFHFSNYQPAGVQFNPALTGATPYDVRLGFQYRKQWAEISEGYTTMGATAEVKGKNMGFGLQLNQNHAGEASLKTTGVMFSAAYHKPLASQSELSLGMAVGRLQKGFNPAAFTFDNQYEEGQGFNQALASGEAFTRTTASITDVAVGLQWKGMLSQDGKLKGWGGFSLAHIHRPDEGFTGFVEELPMKTIANAGIDIRIDSKFTLTPNVFFQNQGVHRELVAGAQVDGQLDPNTSILFGAAYRIEDAIIGQLGLRHRNKHFYFSYDSNTSPLKTATGGNGAWEIGLYLTFNRNKKKELKDTDGDGILDHRDDCPKVPGIPRLKGCPEEEEEVVVEEVEVIRKKKIIIVEEEYEKVDSDRDGITDDIDRCPLEPGLPCFYGCNDKDMDGIIDPNDACPTIFGPIENEGCPVRGRDSDRDGIPDYEDYCVYLKGEREFHGCPDSDKDGISDVEDECPYMKGPRENGGCPQMPPQNKSAKVMVEFDTDEHYIKEEFLIELTEFLNQVPLGQEYRIIISGHTDAEGSAFYNYSLGERRAESVMDFLVRRGVPYYRIDTISYGEKIPRRSNQSEMGRARNRRCEVALIAR